MIKRIKPEGWTSLIIPVKAKYFKLTRALIGKNISTAGGRSTKGSIPFSNWLANSTNLYPTKQTMTKNKSCVPLLTF